MNEFRFYGVFNIEAQRSVINRIASLDDAIDAPEVPHSIWSWFVNHGF